MPMNEKTIVFKCPQCGDTNLNEKMVNIVRLSSCVGFVPAKQDDDDPEIKYAPTDLEADFDCGEIAAYCCDAGHEITASDKFHSWTITNSEDLFEWLRDHNMLED